MLTTRAVNCKPGFAKEIPVSPGNLPFVDPMMLYCPRIHIDENGSVPAFTAQQQNHGADEHRFR